MKNVGAVYHLYVVRSSNGVRQELIDHLGRRGISTGIHYPIALPTSGYSYRNFAAGDTLAPPTHQAKSCLSPMYPELTEQQIQYIVDAIKAFPG